MLRNICLRSSRLSYCSSSLISKRFISESLKKNILALNENFCSPLSVAEAKKLGSKGEIILEDELLLNRYVEELNFAEAKGQIPGQIHYDILIFFFAARGSISVANAILGQMKISNGPEITERTTEAYIDGLVQFGDYNRAYKIYETSKNNAEHLESSAFGALIYGAIKNGKFDDASNIIKACKDQFIPKEVAERIVQ